MPEPLQTKAKKATTASARRQADEAKKAAKDAKLAELDVQFVVAKGEFQQRFYIDGEFGDEMDLAEAFTAFMEQKYPDLWVELNKFAKSKKRKIITPSAPKKPEPPRNADGSLNLTALDAEVASLMVKYKYEPTVAWERV